MASYSQTILQLQGQLRQAAYPADEREYLACVYRLAAELFSGQYRGSGKTFVAHLVGTASILVANGAPVPLVAAGLLHASYEQGDFGFGLRGRHRDKKNEISRTVGADAEEYLERYFRLRWTGETIISLSATAASLPARERHVLLIRLANELEDHLDLGIQFCANSRQRIARMVALGDHFVALSCQLGHEGLAEELSRAFSENQSAPIPTELQSQRGHSSLQIPRSCRRRYATTLREYISRNRLLER